MNNTIEQKIEEIKNRIKTGMDNHLTDFEDGFIKSALLEAITYGQSLERERVIEKINKIKTWVFTAPYGLEIDEKENIIARKRADGEYLKFEDIISALSPNNNTN